MTEMSYRRHSFSTLLIQQVVWRCFRGRQVASDDRCPGENEVLHGQRHKARGGEAGCLLKMVLIQVVEHDVARSQFGTTPALGRSQRRKKRNCGAPMHMSHVQYPRQVIEEPLHLQAMQTDPSEFGKELSARGDGQLRL